MIRNLGQVAAIYIGSSAPRNTNLIWLDNTVVPFVFRAYDGSAWSEIATHKWVRAYVDGGLVTLPPQQLADALNLKFDKASVLQVSGAATDKVMSQKAVTDALKTLSDDFNNKPTNYLPLAGGTMKGNISFNGDTGHIVVGARETSNFVNAVTFNKGSATNSALIGYHSTGGSDSSGALILVPYSTSANPWAKTVGLYIAKNELLLDGKAIATTDQIPSIPSISISNSGSGNAVTAISSSGHTLTVTKGATYLTSHQTIYDLTFQAGTFSAKTFDPNGAAATVNIPTNTSHLTNDSGFITSSALNGYATQAWVNSQNFVKSTSTKKVTDIQPVDALPATQASGVLYLVFG